jgi:hypothetical protein
MDTLYHYCSNDTFVSIVQNRAIWLSSLSLSNDTMEGRLVNGALVRLAERDGIDAKTRDRLRDNVGLMTGLIDGLGFCISEEGDLLSQWRGYGDDAQGVSIGFSYTYLEKLADLYQHKGTSGFTLHKVEYEPEAHEAKVEPTYRELRRSIDTGAFQLEQIEFPSDAKTKLSGRDETIFNAALVFIKKTMTLVPYLFELKSPAFREEREWRLISVLLRGVADSCLHRAVRNRILPYRSFALLSCDTEAIVEVILGPKHQTPAKVVESMLQQAGFGTAKVRRSEVSYR